MCIDPTLGVYVCESNLTTKDCHQIIDVSERCASDRGWTCYTYAKQTMGCRDHDELATICEKPVMTACATIRKHLLRRNFQLQEGVYDDGERIGSIDAKDKKIVTGGGTVVVERTNSSHDATKSKELVLDIREPHVVKYDLSRKERQKLDMHTDKSVWTFLISLSEGRGLDYGGGGTFFEALNSTVHLQQGQMLIFRGKLRHRGVKIHHGSRYLLVGFLVEQSSASKDQT